MKQRFQNQPLFRSRYFLIGAPAALGTWMLGSGFVFLCLASSGIAGPIVQDDADVQEFNSADAENFASDDDIKSRELPVIDREPFDRLTFKQVNRETGRKWVLDVDPIVLDGVGPHARISVGNREGRLVFTYEQGGYPGRRFACPWESLESITRYNELVLEEAETAMDRGDYGTAYRTLVYLKELNIGRTAKLDQLLDKCLYEDGHENLENRRFGEALAAFNSLYQRDQRYPVRGAANLLEKITTCINEFIGDKVEKGDFASARSLLASMREEYGDEVDRVVRLWEIEMERKALASLRDVQSVFESGDGMAAHRGARDTLYVMPTLDSAVKTYNAVIEKFPYVFVGVTQQAVSLDVRRVEDWAARRVGYLLKRWLTEFQKPSDVGGSYLFPGGSIRVVDDQRLRYEIELFENPPSGTPPIKAYELVDRLYSLATVDSPEVFVPWARLINQIEILDSRRVVFTLKAPHVRPEALLVMPWFDELDARNVEFFGPYKQIASQEGEVIFERNDRFQADPEQQNPRIIERVFRDSSRATEALLEGKLDVVDRVYPGDINRLKSDPDIGVKPYLVPSVHMLIPNPRNNHMKSDEFRRALHFGINRKLIVNDVICGGREIDGFEIVSGPFPKGTDASSDLAYAYNFDVKPREHSALLGLVLAQKYVTTETQRLENEGEESVEVETPTVVLAYPATETIKAACNLIAQQWRAIGVKTELRPLPPGTTFPDNDDYDLVYVETQMQEPLVDAYRLFGRNGLVKIVDPTIEQALRNLDQAYSWAKVSNALHRVHQQSANNLSILPLWQVVDHYAYRKNVFNIGNDIVFLYENLLEWRVGGIQLPETEDDER